MNNQAITQIKKQGIFSEKFEDFLILSFLFFCIFNILIFHIVVFSYSFLCCEISIHPYICIGVFAFDAISLLLTLIGFNVKN